MKLKDTPLNQLRVGDTFLWPFVDPWTNKPLTVVPAWVAAFINNPSEGHTPTLLAYQFGKASLTNGQVLGLSPETVHPTIVAEMKGSKFSAWNHTQVVLISDFYEYQRLRSFLSTYLTVVLELTEDIFGKVSYTEEEPLAISVEVDVTDVAMVLELERQWIESIVQLKMPPAGPMFALDIR